MTASPLRRLTVWSWSPWKTIVGTGRVLWALRRSALAHGGEGGADVAGGTHRQAGMHADGRVEVGIGRTHDGGRRTAGGKPGDIDAARRRPDGL